MRPTNFTAPSPLFDMIGIGFGPSNIALAIALDELEHPPVHPSRHASAQRYAPGSSQDFLRCFLEKQSQFLWHGGMLLPSTDMQISFLKDLVSLRNPTSPFTFINYLRQCNRLESFINRKTFFPSRVEFNAYLNWVATHFKNECHYGENVTTITPEFSSAHPGQISALQIHTHDAQGRESLRRTRSLVIATGGKAYIPEPFAACADARITHSSNYLTRLKQNTIDPQIPLTIAVVGAGQSAAEILLDLHDRFPLAQIDLIMRASTLKPADDSPSINEIFNPEYTDYFYAQPLHTRQALLKEFRHTNYAVVDLDLIEKIHATLYEQSVVGEARLQLLTATTIKNVSSNSEGITLQLEQTTSRQRLVKRYQHIILATGYQRDTSQALLRGLEAHLPSINIGRNYRVETPAHFHPPIFIQGASESTHGLSDTLLSVTAIRAQEIAEALTQALHPAAASWKILARHEPRSERGQNTPFIEEMQ